MESNTLQFRKDYSTDCIPKHFLSKTLQEKSKEFPSKSRFDYANEIILFKNMDIYLDCHWHNRYLE